MAYERLTGPIGQPRDDILTAMIAERVTNSFGTPKGKSPPKLKFFLPDWGATAEEEDHGVDQEFADPPGDHR